jgi:undecaprenyl-diphosphatase
MNLLIIFGAKYLVFVIILIAAMFAYRLPAENRKELLIFALFALPLAYMSAKIASVLYFNPRPFVVGNFTPLIAHAADNGFPSDHTLLSAAVATVVYFFHKKLGIGLLTLSVLVGLSRVSAGVHHLLDIFSSVVIAFVIGLIVWKIRNRKNI